MGRCVIAHTQGNNNQQEAVVHDAVTSTVSCHILKVRANNCALQYHGLQASTVR